jgi:cell division septum initiation protein DivIVA
MPTNFIDRLEADVEKLLRDNEKLRALLGRARADVCGHADAGDEEASKLLDEIDQEL